MSPLTWLIFCCGVLPAFCRMTPSSLNRASIPFEVTENPNTANCKEGHFTQPLDHFDQHNKQTFEQRSSQLIQNWGIIVSTPKSFKKYLRMFADSFGTPLFSSPMDQFSTIQGCLPLCSCQEYIPHDTHGFVCCRNEADVTLYVNATGLMWENAEKLGALLVWGEHRYYGKTLPFGTDNPSPKQLKWLSLEQSLADHAALVKHIKVILSRLCFKTVIISITVFCFSDWQYFFPTSYAHI